MYVYTVVACSHFKASASLPNRASPLPLSITFDGSIFCSHDYYLVPLDKNNFKNVRDSGG